MKCYAAGCNYGTRTYSGPKRSKFRFPEDPERRRQWILACRRADSVPGKFSSLCDAHFEPDLIVSNVPEPKELPDGSVKVAQPRGHYCPRLLPHAVPTIFFDDPSGPRIGGTQGKRRLPDEEEFPVEEILAKSLNGLPAKSEKRRKSRAKSESSQEPNEGKPLSSLDDILRCLDEFSNYSKDQQLAPSWLHILQNATEGSERILVLYQLDSASDPPAMTKIVKVDSSRNFEAYDRSHKITDFVAQSLSMKKNRFRSWNQLLAVAGVLESYQVELFRFDFSYSDSEKFGAYGPILDQLNAQKEALVGAEDVERHQDEISKLSFLMEQITLLGRTDDELRFSDALRSWSEHIAKKDPDILTFLSKSGALTLPEFVKHGEMEVDTEQR